MQSIYEGKDLQDEDENSTIPCSIDKDGNEDEKEVQTDLLNGLSISSI